MFAVWACSCSSNEAKTWIDTYDREESSICMDTASIVLSAPVPFSTREGYQPSFSLSSTRRPPTRLFMYPVPGGDGLAPQA
ncbi:hypothetical protein GYMLUDRAFT_487307 [Collybiopsis luxurians FD-317 M1]|uniref:Unplaced genomic scaffold GYMLUscaffold_171, whole genome shotgun sequence n=1 Tax=Collybiopsis luxurians FD-317 M1 TaxID=944289 RepID=A0A0D0AJ50_9AGAR|nr:hypothetical protein GYMLUDRAFT_487307 [Collybiopsis luxurians FD-317 M1]